MTGQHALSDQTIWRGVIAKSVDVSQQIADEAQEILQSNGNPPIIINEQFDPYDGNTPEILLFEDGIQVKHQADERYSSKQGDRAEEKGTQRKRVNSDVIIFQQSTGDFEYLTTPIKEDGNPALSLELLLKAKLIDEYGGGTRSNPLNIVCNSGWSPLHSLSVGISVWTISLRDFGLVPPLPQSASVDGHDRQGQRCQAHIPQGDHSMAMVWSS